MWGGGDHNERKKWALRAVLSMKVRERNDGGNSYLSGGF